MLKRRICYEHERLYRTKGPSNPGKGGGCHFGKITSVTPGLFGEDEVVLVEVEGDLKAVSPEAVTPLKKDIKKQAKEPKI